ncbi:MAG TPA: rod shape-determining protein MreC [Solirubrobacterales bacterium]|nr:rod shape-determining protein MreC [Solirubrobacterales bacterium]
MYRKQVRRRRAVLLLLVAASLTLLSLYYREGNAGPLHGAENVVSTIFSPVSSVTNRALKPVRDLVNWFNETFDARGDKARLQGQVASLRNQLARQQTQQAEAKELSALNELTSGGIVPDGTTPVTARVVGRSPTVWYSTVTIDRGSGDGIRVDDPVVAAQGLAGKITQTTPNTAQVTLITDADSAVTARVQPGGATGVVEPNVGNPNDLQLDFLERGSHIAEGQMVVTAGFSTGTLGSIFPPGIPIGHITQATVEEQQAYQRVHLAPFADLRDMDFVKVLTTHSGGSK